MIEFYNDFIYIPIFNLLVYLYNIVPGHDIGIAIIILTIIIKLVLLPLSLKATKSQKALQELQPKMEALKAKYKDNKEEQAKALMELYKAEKINPLSSCFPLLIQFPFLIAVYQVFIHGFKGDSLDLVYLFISRPESLSPITMGWLDLSHPVYVLAFLSGAAQYFQTKMLMHNKQPQVPGSKDESMTAMINKQMLYMMPILMVFIGFTLPGGLTLYWFISTVLMILQQKIMFKQNNTTSVIAK